MEGTIGSAAKTWRGPPVTEATAIFSAIAVASAVATACSQAQLASAMAVDAACSQPQAGAWLGPGCCQRCAVPWAHRALARPHRTCACASATAVEVALALPQPEALPVVICSSEAGASERQASPHWFANPVTMP